MIPAFMPHAGLAAAVRAFFSNGEQGVWYDPSDRATLFQDYAGTTPVTAIEQPVGLVLDKSKGLELGSPLALSHVILVPLRGTATRNGDGTYTVSNGGYVRFYYNLADLKQGAHYKVEAEVLSGTGMSTLQWCDIGGAFLNSTGIRSVIAGRNYDSTYRFVDFEGGDTNPVTFRLLSVRELPGNHAFQSTSASRPVLSARKNWLVGTETLATQNVTTKALPYVLSFWGTGTITLTGTSTAGPLVGTSANNRVYLEFTPTAGTLTVTVSGTVSKAQLEIANESV